MNWLDWTLLAIIALAAVKGFSRGFIVEVAALLALVAGIWAGVHLSERVTDALGLEIGNGALAFLITFVLVVLLVHLLARFLTTLVNIAQLGLPNKLAGVVFGAIRSAFMISVLFNLIAGYSGGAYPPAKAIDGSKAYAPLRAFAPTLVPALAGTRWLTKAITEHGPEGLTSPLLDPSAQDPPEQAAP